MPTRTINLKMVLNRDTGGLPVRCALWTTHAVVNRAVARIETMLVLCRGDAYWQRNESDEEVQRPSAEVSPMSRQANAGCQKIQGLTKRFVRPSFWQEWTRNRE